MAHRVNMENKKIYIHTHNRNTHRREKKGAILHSSCIHKHLYALIHIFFMFNSAYFRVFITL